VDVSEVKSEKIPLAVDCLDCSVLESKYDKFWRAMRSAFRPMAPSNPEALSTVSRKTQKGCFGYVHNPSQRWFSGLIILSPAQLTDLQHVDFGTCTHINDKSMAVFQVSQWSASSCSRRILPVSAQRVDENMSLLLDKSLNGVRPRTAKRASRIRARTTTPPPRRHSSKSNIRSWERKAANTCSSTHSNGGQESLYR
jgi:hypothetical protein